MERWLAHFVFAAIVLSVGGLYMAIYNVYDAPDQEGLVTEKHYTVESNNEHYYIELDDDSIYEVDSRTYNSISEGEDVSFESCQGQKTENSTEWMTWILLGGGMVCWAFVAYIYANTERPETPNIDMEELERYKRFRELEKLRGGR